MQNGTLDVSSPRLELERVLAGMTYTPGGRDQRVEDLDFPSMVGIFQRLVAAHGRPPTQHLFAGIAAYEAGLPATPAVLGRAGRTWISLIGQLHVCTTLREVYPLVTWDPEADQKYGIDLIVYAHDWEPVGLALRVPGTASEQYAARKTARQVQSGLVVRTLLADKHEYRIGPFWLYARPRVIVAVEQAAAEARDRRRTEHDEEIFEAGFALALEQAGVGDDA